MNQKSAAQSAFYWRALVTLIAGGTGLALAFFAKSAPARIDRTVAIPSVRGGHGSARLTKLRPGTALTGPNPVVVRITPVRGPDRSYQPGATIADLNHGFAAGATRYLHDDGVIYNDTRVCFMWSEDGATTLFEPSHELATTRSVYFPQQITPDGTKIVGSAAFLDALITVPWIGERDIGLKYLPLPPDLQGAAVATSNDGRLVAGTLLGSGFDPPPSQATLWVDGVLQALPTNQLWSEVGSVLEPIVPQHPHPMSSDGSIVVGASGPAADQLQATKWVNGVEKQLSTGQLQPQSSVASFVTDQGVIFGTAMLTDGRVLLVRWDSDGTPQILEPPNGLSVVTLNGIDRSGAAAGGALAMSTSCIVFPDPACNQSPFVWTSSDGFTILPENGHEDFYDLSTVTAVSDNGNVAVGALTASVHQEGDPPDVGFVWTAATGLTLINDIIGLPDPDYWSTDQVSSDGSRVMVTGNRPREDEHDTFQSILDVTWPNVTPTPTSTATPSPTATASGTPCPEPWEFVAPMPLDVYGGAGTSDGTYVYEAGGYSSSSGMTLSVFNRYDPITDIWTTLPDMPTAAFMASAVYYPVSNKIYVFGGQDLNSGVNYNVTRIYDVASNTWSTGANMPDVRSFMASGYSTANGKIYIVSGYNTGDVASAQPNTWEYDPVTNTFSERAPIPHAVGGTFFGVVNDHLYVAGGRDATGTVINLLWDYDILTDTWTPKTQMPALQNNVGGSAVALQRLWVFGGGNPFNSAHENSKTITQTKNRNPDVATRAVRQNDKWHIPDLSAASYVYDPVTDNWSDAPSMSELRSFASGTSIGTTVFAMGGLNGFGSTASVEMLNVCVQEPGCADRMTVFSENFDGVTPPDLPAGWTADNPIDPDGILWVTSDSGDPIPSADSVPNAAFVNAPEAISDKRLESPSIVVQSNSTQLSFRHNFDFETGFDGGVLEISIGGGPFQDVLDAGGSFLTGGYANTISRSFQNPLAGHRAWSGYSGGFITTTVKFPPAAAGQSVALRWRMATDNRNPAAGWRVDSVRITQCVTIPTPSPTASSTATLTPSVTPTPTITATPSLTPAPTPRFTPTPRSRPSPMPRPTALR